MAIPIWNTSPSVNTSRYRRRKLPRTQYDHTMGAGAGTAKPTSMFKNPFGKMSPEELKDFKETLAEMDFGVDQEFLAGGNFGRTQEYGALPYSFDESSMSEMQKRKKLFPFLA